jgi:hypothetical protein
MVQFPSEASPERRMYALGMDHEVLALCGSCRRASRAGSFAGIWDRSLRVALSSGLEEDRCIHRRNLLSNGDNSRTLYRRNTVETWAMRQQTVKLYKIELLPLVVAFTPNSRNLYLKNIGRSPALSIQIAPLYFEIAEELIGGCYLISRTPL